MTDALFEPNPADMMDKTRLYAGLFAVLGFGTFLLMTLRSALLAQAGEALMRYVRYNTFSAMLRQEIGWHDAHPAGVLATRLSSDALFVRKVVADHYGLMLVAASNVICSIVVCFISEGGWAMSILCIAVVYPAMSIAGYFQFAVIGGFSSRSKDAIEKAGQVATEAVSNLRTVASFCGEDALMRRFAATLADGLVAGHRSSFLAGSGYGGSQFVMFSCYAL